jgi:hypothetical protein
VVAIHQIAHKENSLIAIATIDLVEPDRVGPFLRALFLKDGAAFDLTAKLPLVFEPAVSVIA